VLDVQKDPNGRTVVRWPAFNPKQLALLEALDDPRFPYVMAEGGGRAGKTFAIAAWQIRRRLLLPGSKGLVARKKLKNAKAKLWHETYVPMLRPLVRLGVCRLVEAPAAGALFANGARLIVAGLQPHEIDDVLGPQYEDIFANEVSETIWPVIETLMSRLNTSARWPDGSSVSPKLALDQNPPDVLHWTYKILHLGIDPSGEGPRKDAALWRKFHFVPQDNEPNLEKGYVERLSLFSKSRRDRLLLGLYATSQDIIFSDFDPNGGHVVLERLRPPEGARVFRAIDFGYDHPTACLWAWVGSDGVLFIYRAYRRRWATAEECASDIIDLSREDVPGSPEDPFEAGIAQGRFYEATVSDHASEYRHAYRRAGIETTPAKKDVAISIDRIRTRLRPRPPRLVVSYECESLVEELLAYRNAPGRGLDEGETTEKPVKKKDDAVDCLRYLVNEIDGEEVAEAIF